MDYFIDVLNAAQVSSVLFHAFTYCWIDVCPQSSKHPLALVPSAVGPSKASLAVGTLVASTPGAPAGNQLKKERGSSTVSSGSGSGTKHKPELAFPTPFSFLPKVAMIKC